MNRFSTRLAASLIEDRSRETAAARRPDHSRPVREETDDVIRGARAFERILRPFRALADAR